MLEITDIQLVINKRPIIDDMSFALGKSKIGCLLGPSGSGKTALLQCIAGFYRPQRGRVVIDGATVEHDSIHIPTERRRLGMVFQDYALFPHLNVVDNVSFGIHHWPSAKRNETVNHLLKLMSMDAFARRYPHELSGGQQQRVAIARALAPNPKLLLLDEPFSSLDASLTLQLTREIREILIQQNITTLMATHDQDEALAIADMVGLIDHGKMLQWDSAYNIYHKPHSIDIATFVGMGETIQGRLEQGKVRTVLGDFDLQHTTTMPDSGTQVKVLIRPDDIIHDDSSTQVAAIEEKQFRGNEFLYRLRLENGEKLFCFAPSHHNHAIGEKIGIKTDIEHVIVFPDR